MKAIFIVLAMSLISLSACATNPTKGGAKGNSGAIQEGEKFGVKIGMTRSVAIHLLKQQSGISLATSKSCEIQILPSVGECIQGGTQDVFLIARISGNGVIYVISKDDTVVSIAWSLTSGPVL